jgi:hypothetical protein
MKSLPAALVLLLASLTASASADEPPPSEPPTIEYEVRLVHLNSSQPIKPDPVSATGDELSAAMEGWRKARIVTGVTTFKVSARSGEQAVAEAIDERQIAAGPDRFGGRLPDPKGTVPALERRTASLKLRGKWDRKVIETEFEFAEKTASEPLGEVPLDAFDKPSYWALPPVGITMKTNVSFNDGETIRLGGQTSRGNEQGYQASVVVVTARIVRPKK